MKKRKRVLADAFPLAESINHAEVLKTFIALRERDEERARRAKAERSAAGAVPQAVRNLWAEPILLHDIQSGAGVSSVYDKNSSNPQRGG